jgi:hypothetical protein
MAEGSGAKVAAESCAGGSCRGAPPAGGNAADGEGGGSSTVVDPEAGAGAGATAADGGRAGGSAVVDDGCALAARVAGAGAGAVGAGRGACVSAGRVTVPLRVKSRSCGGPTSVALVAGAGVTAFCADAVPAAAASSAAAAAITMRQPDFIILNAFKQMRSRAPRPMACGASAFKHRLH